MAVQQSFNSYERTQQGSTTSPLPAFYELKPSFPIRPVLNTLRGSFLPPSCSSPAFQHGFAFLEPFLDLAEGWCVHPEHTAASSENLLRVYSQQGALFTLPVYKRLCTFFKAREETQVRKGSRNQGYPTGNVGP